MYFILRIFVWFSNKCINVHSVVIYSSIKIKNFLENGDDQFNFWVVHIFKDIDLV